ncbi:hypothetical protein AAZX31_12G197200 [Glycine max]|nr:hypothetical protein GLYMA_12G208650v4 [Glycine max]KAH1144188.1 hypothetical protein GYH30_034428 [Glycine max]
MLPMFLISNLMTIFVAQSSRSLRSFSYISISHPHTCELHRALRGFSLRDNASRLKYIFVCVSFLHSFVGGSTSASPSCRCRRQRSL